MNGTDLNLISLARFPHRRGQPRKLRQKIDVHGNIFLPIFRSHRHATAPSRAPDERRESAPLRAPCDHRDEPRCSTTKIPYCLLGGIIHIGDRAHTGHYRMLEFRDTYKDRDQLEAKDLIMHDDNTKPIEATSANLSQIHHNAYVMLFKKI